MVAPLSTEQQRDAVRRYGFDAYVANTDVLNAHSLTAAQLRFLRVHLRSNFDPQDAMSNPTLHSYGCALETLQIDDDASWATRVQQRIATALRWRRLH